MSIFVADGTVRHRVTPAGTASAWGMRVTKAVEKVDPFSTWLLVAPYAAQPAGDLSRAIKQVLESTGWSNRVLASVLGTTHPTIQAIKRGRQPERRTDLAAALTKTAEVVERL